MYTSLYQRLAWLRLRYRISSVYLIVQKEDVVDDCDIQGTLYQDDFVSIKPLFTLNEQYNEA